MIRQALFRLRATSEELFGPLPGAMLRELRLPWIQALGVRTVVDAGANIGQFASAARAAFPQAQIVSFEPLPDCFEQLQRRFRKDRRFQAFQLALGAVSEERELQRSDYTPSSSLLPMENRHQQAFPDTGRTAPIRVQVRTLDEALQGAALEEPLLLKLDVQGFELQVLEGARRTLERCALVLLEASLTPLYRGEALLPALQAHLAKSNFTLSGLAGSLRDPRDGRPLQVDAIFERASK